MPDWLLITTSAIGGFAIGVGGLIVNWLSTRHKPPIESGMAMAQSYERQIASAERRQDSDAVERLRLEAEAQEEAWRTSFRFGAPPAIVARALEYSPTEYRMVEDTLAQKNAEDLSKREAEREVVMALIAWEQVREEVQRVTDQFVASGPIGVSGEIPLPPRVLDAEGMAEIQQAEAKVQEMFEAHQQAIAKWRSLDTERRARLRATVRNILDRGFLLERSDMDRILGGAGYAIDEINQEVEKLIREGVLRRSEDGLFLVLTEPSSS